MDTNETKTASVATAPATNTASDGAPNQGGDARDDARDELSDELRDEERRGILSGRVYALLWEGLSLRAIAREPNAPTLGTLQRWLAGDAEFRAEYKRIRRCQRETMMDEAVAMADDPDDDLSAARLRFAARRWRIDHDARTSARRAAQDAINARDADRRRERAKREAETRKRQQEQERRQKQYEETMKKIRGW